ncbi:hypothetical protein vseg_013364 [Gypsophila vaccaria]
MKVDQDAFYLSGQADLWWHENKDKLSKPSYQTDLKDEETQVTFGWTQFKKALTQEFFPDPMRKAKRSNSLEQGSMSVQEYYNKFQELARFTPEMVPTEEARASKFEDGLSLNIQERLCGASYDTMLQVYTRACNIERVLNLQKRTTREKRKDVPFGGAQGFLKRGNFGNHPAKFHSAGNPRTFTQTSIKPRAQSQRAFKERRFICKRCNGNPSGKDCNGNLIECNICGKLGHRAYECFKNPHNSKKPMQGGPMPSSGSAVNPNRSQFPYRYTI